MIKINEEFNLDCNDKLHRVNGKEVKNTKGAVRKILSNSGYGNDGKIFKKGTNSTTDQYTTNQYIVELKKFIGRREYIGFEKLKQPLEEMFNDIDSIPKKELSDTLGHIFRHERRENFISDWLAYLFNPDKMGTNEPFQSLFDLSDIEGEFIPIGGIEREKDLTYNNDSGNTVDCGRIDFFVETDGAIVGIENKIDCDFTTHDQLEKYSRWLEQRAVLKEKDWYLFLLYPSSNKKIGKNTKANQKNIKIITYEGLIEKWETIKIDCVKSLRQMIIFEDFIKHVKEYVIMEDKQLLNITAIQFLDEKSKQIEQINRIKDAAKEQLRCYFDTKLKMLKEDGWDVNVSSGAQYIQYYKNDWKSGVHFELVNIISKDDESNFPPKHFHLEFHHEKVKSDELEGLSQRIKENKDCYELKYKSEKEIEEVTNGMLEKLRNTAKDYAAKVDEILKKSSR